jgi:alkaline phosphatase D
MDRRSFLRVAGAGAGTLVVATSMPAAAAPSAKPYFQHGLASGDPLPDRVVLWTRVSPTAASFPGSGAGPVVDVRWQVATDPGFRRVVSSGTASTGPGTDHTVKVDAAGLAPATWYWYRFVLDGVRSPVGRTRTAPAPDSAVAGLRLGVVSCANYEGGFFSPYRHLAARTDLHAVLHLGDYLYEYAPGEYGPGPAIGRTHQPAHEMVGLADYRQRHALYKTDADLQALHASVPFIVTWDDHETTNDAWSGGAENHQSTEGSYAVRKAAARRAYGEWMPIRTPDPTTIYRRLQFGRLVDLTMLDLRSYRSQQVDAASAGAVDDPARTITGRAQMDFLKAGLVSSTAQWKLVGNPVMISPVVFPPLPATIGRPLADLTGLLPPDGVPYNYDQWDGYTADRRELLTDLQDRRVQDTVFLTGDIHSTWACDVPVDAGTYPVSPSVATELVCTSVTSDNLNEITKTPPRTTSLAVEAGIQGANRHIKALEFDSHGYSVLDVRPDRVQMDWFYVSERTDPAATSRFALAFRVAAGTQRVTRTTSPIS